MFGSLQVNNILFISYSIVTALAFKFIYFYDQSETGQLSFKQKKHLNAIVSKNQWALNYRD